MTRRNLDCNWNAHGAEIGALLLILWILFLRLKYKWNEFVKYAPSPLISFHCYSFIEHNNNKNNNNDIDNDDNNSYIN